MVDKARMQELIRRAPGAQGVFGPTSALMAALGLVMGLAACEGFADEGHPVLTALGRSRGLRLQELETGGFHGLSDLTHTTDAQGRPLYWAIPEQQRALVQLDLSDPEHPKVTAKPRPIIGIDSDYDTESVTALGQGRFAIGTETQQGKRPVDTIFIVAGSSGEDPDAGPLNVVDTLAMPYNLWPGLRVRRNEGLEGLCAAGPALLASSESIGRLPSGQRFAPLGRYELQDGRWVPYSMALTLPTGRLSAVQCRVHPQAPDRIEILAVERHYGVGRILRATVPLRLEPDTCLAPQVIFPEVLADLSPLLAPLANFEGIDWLPNGDVLLVTDNHMGFIRGPSFLLRLPTP